MANLPSSQPSQYRTLVLNLILLNLNLLSVGPAYTRASQLRQLPDGQAARESLITNPAIP